MKYNRYCDIGTVIYTRILISWFTRIVVLLDNQQIVRSNYYVKGYDEHRNKLPYPYNYIIGSADCSILQIRFDIYYAVRVLLASFETKRKFYCVHSRQRNVIVE